MARSVACAAGEPNVATHYCINQIGATILLIPVIPHTVTDIFIISHRAKWTGHGQRTQTLVCLINLA